TTISALFPYTTLFRSGQVPGAEGNGGDDYREPEQRRAWAMPAGQRHQPHQQGHQEQAQLQFFGDAAVEGGEQAFDGRGRGGRGRSEEHTSELQSRENL